jgi:Protein of unknown function (DUF4199)
MNEIIKKNGITFGIILGLVSILLTTSIYIVDLNLIMSYWIGSLKLFIYAILFIVLLNKTKKQLNGTFSFKDAFTTFFIAAVILIVASTLFEYILYNLIDPAAKETIKEITIKSVVESMKKFGAPSSAIKDALKDIKNNDPFSFGKQFLGLGMSILVSAIFALIFAAFFKTPNKQEI